MVVEAIDLLRRTMLAVALCASALLLFATSAGAQTYPPVPGGPTGGGGVTPIVAPVGTGVSPVVVVQGAPTVGVTSAGGAGSVGVVPGAQALSRTGASSTLPLIALATGAVVLGFTLLGVTRRRSSAAPPAPTTA